METKSILVLDNIIDASEVVYSADNYRGILMAFFILTAASRYISATASVVS
jgi:hypothetical protein